MMRQGKRTHDDAHRPLGGKGKRANRTPGRTMNWGAAELVERPACKECGRLLPHGFFGCDKDPACKD